jgi:hypothetical protein
VLGTLAVCVCGVLAVGVGHLPAMRDAAAGGTGAEAEARTWRRLWLPLLPALCALAALLGWAAQEPTETDELLRPLAFVLAAPLLLIAARAVARGLAGLRRSPTAPHAATVGLIRPRVLVSRALCGDLDAPGLAAVDAHERAHARHRDPLRLWLAQLATDLQWPAGGARRRHDDWRRALELARDEEARREGIPGADLAAAILAVARLGSPRPTGTTAALTGADLDFAARIHRLLEPLPAPGRGRVSITPWIAGAAVLAAAAVGVLFGDALVRALPIVTL